MKFKELQNALLKLFAEVGFTESKNKDGSKTVAFAIREKLKKGVNPKAAKAETYYHGFRFTKAELKELELEEMTQRIQFMFDRVMQDFKYEKTKKAIDKVAEKVNEAPAEDACKEG